MDRGGFKKTLYVFHFTAAVNVNDLSQLNMMVEYFSNVKQEQSCHQVASKSVRIAIDEDHCYAFKPGRVKAEYWPEYDNMAATAFTSSQVSQD